MNCLVLYKKPIEAVWDCDSCGLSLELIFLIPTGGFMFVSLGKVWAAASEGEWPVSAYIAMQHSKPTLEMGLE